jgi:hypothetical protein
MKQSKRILSFLMALLMFASTFSIMANAAASYKDAGIPASAYNDLDEPTLTLDQCSSMLLDYVDKFLAEKDIMLDMSVFGTLNLTSVDNILNSIYGVGNNYIFMQFAIFPNPWAVFDKSAISTYRRTSTPANTADINVIYSIIQFLNDNESIFTGIIDGDTSNWGVFKPLADLIDININQTIKKALFEVANPGTIVPSPVNDTADNMIQQILNNFIIGAGMPQLAGSIDINSGTGSTYDFLENLLQNTYNLVLVPMLNTDLKKAVREVCGVVYDDSVNFPNGDASNLNSNSDNLNIDFVIPAHTFAAGATLVSDLNSILGEIANAVIKGYSGWTAGDNTLLLDNLANAVKYVLANTGSEFFTDYVAAASPAQINAMTNQQLFSYLIRSVLNSTVDTMNIPADADSLVKVAWYAVKEILAEKVPQNSYTVSAYPQTLDGLLNMLGDLAVYYINQTIDMNPAAGTLPGAGLLPYGQTFDVTLTSVMAWVKTNYGGLFNVTLTGTDGWADLNTLVTAVFPSNWLSGFTNVKTLVKTQMLQNMLDLNTAPLFALFNHAAGNDLATKTIKKVLLERIATVVNLFTTSVPLTYTTFDQMIDNANLKTIAGSICTQLNTRRASIMPVILPLLDKLTGYAVPEKLAIPSIILPNQISTATTFQIRNNSTGVNTGATNKAGTFSQDALYKIKIVSIASSIPAITPTNLVGTVISSGESVNCALSGTFAANQVLMVTMTYDIYTELGTKLTAQPLTAMAFSYISAVVDDGLNGITIDTNSNNYHAMKYFNTYLNYGSAPVEPVLPENPTEAQTARYNTDHAQWVLDLAAYNTGKNASMAELSTLTVQLTRTPNSTLGTQSQAATVTRGTATVAPNLIANGVTAAPFTAISTDGNGGTWNIPYYSVSAATTRPADGLYSSNFVFTAGKTSIFYTSETFTIPHKVVLYNDYGLPGLLSAELSAKRDPSNYSGGASGAEWQNYISALETAVAVQYRPRTASIFMSVQAPAYEGTVQDLKDAITALDATQIVTGVTILETAIDTVQPPNAAGLSYDDPSYIYLGMADYVPYTYLNYEREAENCRALIASQQQASPVDISYALWRLNLYGGRLIRVQADKSRLSEDLAAIQAAAPVQSQYTTLSWAAFQKALAFAVTVNAASATAVDGSGNWVLRQTKVDTAREKLVASYKQLVQVADYTQLNFWITIAKGLNPEYYTWEFWAKFEIAFNAAQAVPLEMSNSPEHQAIIDKAAANLHDAISGQPQPPVIEPVAHPHVKIGYNSRIGDYLTGLVIGTGAHGLVGSTTGGHVVFNDTANGPGTGSTVSLIYDTTNIVEKIYNVIIYGDLNGDANVDSIDAGMAVDFLNYIITLTPVQLFAGDVNGDGNVDSIDAGMMVDNENYMITIPQY